jgi:Peptidase propeptide and YPEB domain
VDERPIRVRIERSPDEEPAKGPLRPSKRGVLAFAALLAVTIVAAQSCQQSQIRVSKERAIETARAEAGFAPERTQIRLVRQGLNGDPFWAVSFSVPASDGDGYSKLTTVRVDANTGKVEAVNREQ